MPTFQTLTSGAIAELTARKNPTPSIDLTEYNAAVTAAASLMGAGLKAGQIGVGEWLVDHTDNTRVIKRRTTTAAKNLGYDLQWSAKPSSDTLVFFLLDPNRVKATRAPRAPKVEATDNTEAPTPRGRRRAAASE